MSGNIKKTFFIFFTLSLLSIQILSFGADLHFMVIADDQTNIAKMCQLDQQRIREEAKRIALYSELNLKEKKFDYSTTSPGDIINWILDLKVQPDDVIIFYYSGHGYRFQEKDSIWPMLNILNSAYGLDFKIILEAIESKNARLSIAFADACNSFIDAQASKEQEPKRLKKQMQNLYQIALNYKKLFRESSGMIAIVGSDVGQYSWCDELNGGFFTFSFLRAVHSCLSFNSGDLDWALVLQNTVKQVDGLMKTSGLEKDGYQQTPVYLYNIH